MYGREIISVYVNNVKNNTDDRIDEIIEWANKNCTGYVGHRVTNSDNWSESQYLDLEVFFNDQKSASWFHLKWS